MEDFEVHPVGTASRIKELEDRLQTLEEKVDDIKDDLNYTVALVTDLYEKVNI